MISQFKRKEIPFKELVLKTKWFPNYTWNKSGIFKIDSKRWFLKLWKEYKIFPSEIKKKNQNGILTLEFHFNQNFIDYF